MNDERVGSVRVKHLRAPDLHPRAQHGDARVLEQRLEAHAGKGRAALGSIPPWAARPRPKLQRLHDHHQPGRIAAARRHRRRRVLAPRRTCLRIKLSTYPDRDTWTMFDAAGRPGVRSDGRERVRSPVRLRRATGRAAPPTAPAEPRRGPRRQSASSRSRSPSGRHVTTGVAKVRHQRVGCLRAWSIDGLARPVWKISRLGLGCGNFGGVGSAPAFFGKGENEEQAVALLDRAVDAGINFVDTANAYGGGRAIRN